MAKETSLVITRENSEVGYPSIICIGTTLVRATSLRIFTEDDLTPRRLLPGRAGLDIVCKPDRVIIIARGTDSCTFDSKTLWRDVHVPIMESRSYPLTIGDLKFVATVAIAEPRTVFAETVEPKKRNLLEKFLHFLFPWS